jgi:hypothetical protein
MLLLDLAWMRELCNINHPQPRCHQPHEFDAMEHFATADDRRPPPAPVVVVFTPILAVICRGRYRGILAWEDPEMQAIWREEALDLVPMPDDPCEIVRGVPFERFKGWCNEGGLAVIGDRVINRSELVPVLKHLQPAPITMAWKKATGEPLHIMTPVWKVAYRTFVDRDATDLPHWTNG